MVKWQDDFHTHMSERWPALERGQPAAETQRKHIPVRLYKQALRLDEKTQEISDALSDINILNAGKKRDKALQIVSKWLPDAENFTAQLKKVDGYIRSLESGSRSIEAMLKSDIADLKDKIEEKDDSLLKYRMKIHRLQEMIRQHKQLLSRIPPDVLGELRKKGSRDRGR